MFWLEFFSPGATFVARSRPICLSLMLSVLAIFRLESFCSANSTAYPARTNEVRFEARWKLGQMLAQVEKKPGARIDTSSRAGKRYFMAYLREIELDKNRANEALVLEPQKGQRRPLSQRRGQKRQCCAPPQGRRPLLEIRG